MSTAKCFVAAFPSRSSRSVVSRGFGLKCRRAGCQKKILLLTPLIDPGIQCAAPYAPGHALGVSITGHSPGSHAEDPAGRQRWTQSGSRYCMWRSGSPTSRKAPLHACQKGNATQATKPTTHTAISLCTSKTLQNKLTWANQQVLGSKTVANQRSPHIQVRSCRDQTAQLIGSTVAPLIFTTANQLLVGVGGHVLAVGGHVAAYGRELGEVGNLRSHRHRGS